MALSRRQVSQLQKIVETVQAILAADEKPGSQPSKQKTASRTAGKTSFRRSGKELAAFRKALRAERKSGVPVAEIAQRHKVSKSYIYQL